MGAAEPHSVRLHALLSRCVGHGSRCLGHCRWSRRAVVSVQEVPAAARQAELALLCQIVTDHVSKI